MTTVKKYAALHSCSTAGLRPLTNQILEVLLDRINTPEETNLLPCDDIPLLNVAGASTIPMLQRAARESLQQVIEQEDRQLDLIHAYRTIAQQWVLRQWAGTCDGISQAASPGTSQHEQALAIDIDDNELWRSALIDNGWIWAGPGDRGHFRYAGDDVNPNIILESVRSFQILWNRNHPDEPIEEDGIYGEQETGPALRRSPIEGFPIVF